MIIRITIEYILWNIYYGIYIMINYFYITINMVIKQL